MLTPGISVLICCYNGASRLPDTLAHLALQQVPSHIPWEIIVIDNASTDNTAEVAKTEWKRYNLSIPCHVISEPQPGKNYAFKTGIAKAAHAYIITCDDDNRLYPNYIALAFGQMEADKRIGALGGCGIFDPEEPRWTEVNKYKECYVNGPQPWAVTAHWVYGAGTVLRVEFLKNMLQSGWKQVTSGRQGNSLICGEDVEICLLYHLGGYQIIYNEQLKFKHFVPLKRQQISYILRLAYWVSFSNVLLNNYRLLYNHTPATYNTMLIKWRNSLLIRYAKFSAILFIQFIKKRKRVSIEQQIIKNELRGNLHALLTHRRSINKHFKELQKFIKSEAFKQVSLSTSAIPNEF